MPEGDTVAWTAARLQAALGGATLTRAELRWPSLAEADLVGATTVRVVARGGKSGITNTLPGRLERVRAELAPQVSRLLAGE